MLAVIGIGNPGAEYAGTRHNCGFAVVDRIAAEEGLDFDRNKKWKADVASWRVDEERILLIKPQTYVNLSGATVQGILAFYKLPPSSLLVVVDDINLPLGTLRLRPQGSAGGHNGLRDIEARIGRAYPRLRCGVGAPEGDQVAHVLDRFADHERDDAEAMIAKAADCVRGWVRKGCEVMCVYNGPLRPPEPKPKPDVDTDAEEAEGAEGSPPDRRP